MTVQAQSGREPAAGSTGSQETVQRVQAVVVATTHWDRAWYVPFQEFRWALVELIDRVIAILEGDPRYRAFMLDGQSVVVEDYLEIRPEREPTLRRLVAEGRLQVGPWYVLPDEYLVSPEALVRNLLRGIRLADSWGGAMRCGYNPDSFGHIRQLPQILQGFGIGSTFFWRGFGDEGERVPNEFWWQAPDGSRVLASFLRLGYGNVGRLGYASREGELRPFRPDPELAWRQAASVIDLLAPHAAAGVVLLLNGGDHQLPQPELPDVIERLQRAGYRVVHGTLDDYVAAVRARGPELPVVEGEFNRGRYSPILQGVYSTRMPLKQRNWAVQQLLERVAEPAAVFAWLGGGEYPARALEQAWRWLLLNHPHDDICGCSADQVHREMVHRFDQAEQLGRIVARESLRALAERVAVGGEPAMVVWNLSPHPRGGVACVSVPFGEEQPRAEAQVVLVDPDGRAHDVQILDVRESFWAEPRRTRRRWVLDLAFEASLPAAGYCAYNLVWRTAEAPSGSGGATEPAPAPGPATPGAARAPEPGPAEPTRGVRVGADGMENEHLRVRVHPDGTLWVVHKATGAEFGPLHVLEDTEDAGDSYDYSPAPRGSTLWLTGGSAAMRWVHTGPLRATLELKRELQLPAALTPDRQGRSGETVFCPLVTRVSLDRGSRRLEFVTEFQNAARDHRLRAWFCTPLSAGEVLVDGHFDLLRRPVGFEPRPGWVQPPVPTAPFRRFVAVAGSELGLGAAEGPGVGGDSRRACGVGLALLTRGLPEYEAVAAGALPAPLAGFGGGTTSGEAGAAGPAGSSGVSLALTLLRSVGWLSREDLRTRPGHAGPAIEVPEAQVLGQHRWEYALVWFDSLQELLEQAEAYHNPPVAVRADSCFGMLSEELEALHQRGLVRGQAPARDLPPRSSYLEILPCGIPLTALKRSEDGQDVVVRFVNLFDEPREVQVRTGFAIVQACKARLDETPVQTLETDGQQVRLSVRSREVVTLRLRPPGATPGRR